MTREAIMQSKKLCRRGGGAGDRAGGVSLPDDIIYELLLRQPPMVLRRFQRVCKGWRALISDPDFLAERRYRVSADPLIVAMFGTTPAERELRLLDMEGNVLRVFNVTGGKAAFLAPARLDLIFVDRMELGAMVIDPASGCDFTIIGTADPQPQHPLDYFWGQDKFRYITVNDYSFGRAVPSGDYKVLRLHVVRTSRVGERHSQWCEVATIMDDGAEPTWRQKPWGPFFDTSFSCKHKATVNGDLYFMLTNTESASDGRNLIATFNLESEEWKAKSIKVPMLGRKKVDTWCISLAELKGTLCMVHRVPNLTDSGGQYANLWLLKDRNRSIWAKEYKIQMPETLLFTKPLDVLLDGTIFLLNKWKAGKNEKCHRYILQIYNSSTKAFTDFMQMAEGFDGRIAFYTGSLQS